MERIRQPEFSIPIDVGDGEHYTFDPHFDTVHGFRFWGHSIIKVIIEGEGLGQIHVPLEVGEDLAERAECEVFYREQMGQREYESYQNFMAKNLDASWLED